MGQSIQKFTDQWGGELSTVLLRIVGTVHQIGASAYIYHCFAQSLVHWDKALTITLHMPVLLHSLLKCTTKGNTDILNQVVCIDLYIPISFNSESEKTVVSHGCEDMIKEGQSRIYRLAGCIEIETKCYRRFTGIPFNIYQSAAHCLISSVFILTSFACPCGATETTKIA